MSPRPRLWQAARERRSRHLWSRHHGLAPPPWRSRHSGAKKPAIFEFQTVVWRDEVRLGYPEAVLIGWFDEHTHTLAFELRHAFVERDRLSLHQSRQRGHLVRGACTAIASRASGSGAYSANCHS